jgi:hypothetical protein
MPIAQWTIEIKPAADGGVYFRPRIKGAKKGQPLQAKPNDLVIWANRTDLDLALQAKDTTIRPDFDRTVPAGGSSEQYIVPSRTKDIEYSCKDPLQTHTIKLS